MFCTCEKPLELQLWIRKVPAKAFGFPDRSGIWVPVGQERLRHLLHHRRNHVSSPPARQPRCCTRPLEGLLDLLFVHVQDRHDLAEPAVPQEYGDRMGSRLPLGLCGW